MSTSTKRRTHVSRDLTDSAVRERQAPAKPERVRLHSKRLGSQQVVSIRGRRVQPVKPNSAVPRVTAFAFALLLSGIAVAMWLSGLSTQQTFRINDLMVKDQNLVNEIETLNRDYQNLSSTAELTRRAGEMNMAVPKSPGVLEVGGDGEITQRREVNNDRSPINDVNGSPERTDRPSSDPAATDGVSVQPRPQLEELSGGLAPYQPSAGSAD